ncbi:hypothetical protein IT157_08125 [bacterium]|nr:hypothetical protein [bacterium]
MYDIHNHVLPGVDDGASGMRQSLRMLEGAIHQGITHVVCTPHANDRSGPRANELFQERFQELKAEVTKLELPIEIGLGSEIMFGADIEQTLKQPFATINGHGRYFLLEFPTKTPFEIIHNVVRASIRWGKRPVIAHHERFTLASQNEEQLRTLRASGAILTMDAGSLTGRFGKVMQKHARALMSSGHIEILASDAHDEALQGFCLAEGREEAAGLVGMVEANKMALDAPRRVWNNDDWPEVNLKQ